MGKRMGKRIGRGRVGGRAASLSPSSLRDITDRIALTNGRLSAGMTQRQIRRSQSQSASARPIKWRKIPNVNYVWFLGSMFVVLYNTHVHALINLISYAWTQTGTTWKDREAERSRQTQHFAASQTAKLTDQTGSVKLNREITFSLQRNTTFLIFIYLFCDGNNAAVCSFSKLSNSFLKMCRSFLI